MTYQYFYPTIDCLSSEMLQKCSSKDIKVLNQLFIIFRIAKKSLTLKHLYIQPSEIYIKSKTGYAIESISRSISKLTQLGIIRTTHRRQRLGKWQTNLYHLGDEILNKVPWLRKSLEKLRHQPIDQNVKLEHTNALKNDQTDEELLSYSQWKRLMTETNTS